MKPLLINYLIEYHWNKWENNWDKILNSECYAYIISKNEGYIYGRDCPDVNMPIQDYFKDLFFEDEEKLIQFLEELKLTKPT